jgi:hypothetical protein
VCPSGLSITLSVSVSGSRCCAPLAASATAAAAFLAAAAYWRRRYGKTMGRWVGEHCLKALCVVDGAVQTMFLLFF